MNTIEVTVVHEIAATPHELFDHWLDHTSPRGPWSSGIRMIMNPVIGGLFYWADKDSEREWAHYGRFLCIERPLHIEYTWMSEPTKGLESIVSVTFHSTGDQTEVTLRHSGLPNDKDGLDHKDGWTRILDAMGERFRRMP